MNLMRSGRRLLLVLLLVVIAVLLMGAAGIATWEYTNSNAFCSNACHDVHPEEPYAHRLSQHMSVDCVECHVGRISTFKAMAVKSTHVAHAWALLTGYERPLTSPSMPPSQESCEGCHASEPHQYNSIRVRKHYAPDQTNKETAVGVVLRTAGQPLAEGGTQGIHWHTRHNVRYIATDPQKLNIPWVEVTKAGGNTVTYVDPTATLYEDDIAKAEKHVMDCIDCHNRSGHPFKDPEALIDEALAERDLNPRLPFVKARVVKLLRQEFTTEEEAMQLVEQAWEQYQRDFPDLPQQHPEAFAEAKQFVKERQEFMVDLMGRGKFLEPGVSWRSFPDHSGHKTTPGCFRCHSGRHADAHGNLIPVNCTLCHSVPVIVRYGQIPQNWIAMLDLPKPPSHHRDDFMSAHRMLLDDSCSTCHGEIRFGTDDKTFCSNSGCHGQQWPNLTLSPR